MNGNETAKSGRTLCRVGIGAGLLRQALLLLVLVERVFGSFEFGAGRFQVLGRGGQASAKQRHSRGDQPTGGGSRRTPSG